MPDISQWEFEEFLTKAELNTCRGGIRDCLSNNVEA